MANYIIIGGDSKEYGPVSEADVRHWISEGRLNGQSRVKAESDAEFRELALFPEFAAALQAQQVHAPAATPPNPMGFLDRDYELDIGGCITRGWELMKENFGTIFGTFIIAFLVMMAAGVALGLVSLPLNKIVMHSPAGVHVMFNYVNNAVMALVTGPLFGGLFLVYLKTIRKEATGVGEVFAGFQRCYAQLFLGALVVGLITGACMLPLQYVFQTKAGPVLEQMQAAQNDPSAMQNLLPQLMPALSGCLPVLLVCMVPVTFFTVCFQFTLPLIIDKGLNFSTAMKTSWKMVMKHWWLVFGLTVLVGLVVCLGFLGCCIGVIFTSPIGLAAMMYAYETIFGTAKE